jgi:anhydro-N-acetylmuramic acid kinase
LISPEILYNIYKIPIVYNFRESDIYHGGSGAPLMPFLDYLLFRRSKANIVTLNIGGISNITYIPSSGNKSKIIGFDTGPGMSLIDKGSEIFFGKSIDRDAVYSSKGEINKILLNELMKTDYIFKIPPKSTDSNEFGYPLIDSIINRFNSISSFDVIRTLVQFTIDSIQLNIDKFIKVNDFKLVYSGGGTDHPIILNWLDNMPCITESISKYSIDSSIKESLLMASLGCSRIKKIPSNIPSVTGAKKYISLGDIYER